LQELKEDLTVAEFLRRHLAGPEYDRLRHSIERRVEGYDAADPERASILALREEWMDGGRNTQARIIGGYGALVDFLTAQCRNHGVAIHLGSAVSAVEASNGRGIIRCAKGDALEYDAVVLTVPLPLLREIVLPPAERERAAAAAHIGFGNVIKILLRFEIRWWVEKRMDLADLTFLLSDARIPVWWTQHPADLPVLTGWFGGPKTEAMANLGEHELIEAGLASLAEITGLVEFSTAATSAPDDVVSNRSVIACGKMRSITVGRITGAEIDRSRASRRELIRCAPSTKHATEGARIGGQ
jgi:monoamine oxidase